MQRGDSLKNFCWRYQPKLLSFSYCKGWWIQLRGYHPHCNRFLPSPNVRWELEVTCYTLKPVCQPIVFYRISRLGCPFGLLFCTLKVKILASSFLLCLATKIGNWPCLEKEMHYRLRGNCCKSVFSIDFSIDCAAWVSFLVSFSDATLALSP